MTLNIVALMEVIAQTDGVVNLTISREPVKSNGFKVSIIRYDSDKWPSARTHDVEQGIRDVASKIGIETKQAIRKMPGM